MNHSPGMTASRREYNKLGGPGGVNSYQSTVGAKRVPSKIKVGWTEDADAATATPVLDGYWSATAPLNTSACIR